MPYPEDLDPAGLPVEDSTEPFWLSERSRLDRYRSTEELPPATDVVIIGSGLSGSFLAYNLLKARPSLKIVMLEARETCSGATARNGGQVKTDPYISYPGRKAKFGATVANQLVNFETDHLARYIKFLEEDPISCSFHVTSAYDVCMTEECAATAKKGYHERKTDWPDDVAKLRELADTEELQRVSGVKGGHWGCTYRVASIWPYKLAIGLLERCIKMAKAGGGSFNLQTTTPVLELASLANGQHVVSTKRGRISATKVALCTNGYTSHLLHEMRNKVMAIRGTASSLLPATTQLPDTPSSKVFRPLFTSFAFKYGDTGEYMISRQEGRKEMILGGAKSTYKHDLSSWYGNVDDSQQLPGAPEHFTNYLPRHLVNWPHATSNVDRVWTGILGYSSDALPFVGQHPVKPDGLFVSAGFHGHGMCRIFGCSYALAELMLSDKVGQAGLDVLGDAGLPAPYFFTKERLQSTENVVLGISKA